MAERETQEPLICIKCNEAVFLDPKKEICYTGTLKIRETLIDSLVRHRKRG